MNKGTILDYVKFKVRSRMQLMSAVDTIIDQVIADIPIYVRAAVISLQRMDLIGPKEVQIDLVDKKENHYNKHTGDVLYSYVRLPDDFRELKSMIIDPIPTIDYKPSVNEYEAIRRYNDNEWYFVIRENEMVQDGPKVPRLIFVPWPGDNSVLLLSYHTNGLAESLDYLDETYWDAVADKVMAELNLVSQQKADQSAADVIAQKKNPYGRANANGAAPRVRSTFFGGKNFKV